MQGKITLITPPDIFENESKSVLFMHLAESDQETVSQWLAKSNVSENINIYFYDGGIDITWLLHALSRSEYSYIDLDNLDEHTSLLAGYILGKKTVVYKTDNENTAAISHYINQSRITNIEIFLERVFNGKDGSKT